MKRFPIGILTLGILLGACASEDTSSPEEQGYLPPTSLPSPSPKPSTPDPGWTSGVGNSNSGGGSSPTPTKTCPSDMQLVKGDANLGQADFCMDKNMNAGYPAAANLPWADGLCSGTTGYAVNVGAGKHLCFASEMQSACITGINTWYTWVKRSPAPVVSPWRGQVDNLWGDYIMGTAGSQCSQFGVTSHAGDTDTNSALRFYCCK